MKRRQWSLKQALRMLAVDSYVYFFSTLYRVAPWLAALALEARIARLLARIQYGVSKAQRQRVITRLGRVLGEDPRSGRITQITRDVFERRWVEAEPNALLRLTRAGKAQDEACQSVRIENFTRITDALEQGKGAILWNSFFGQPLLDRAVLSREGLPLCHVHYGREELPDWMRRSPLRLHYRSAKKQFVAEVIDIQRGSLAYLKAVIAWLKDNRVVIINATGGSGHAFVEIDFLGETRLFATGGISLARTTGAPILPIFCFSDEQGFERLVVEKPLELGGGADREAAVARVLSAYSGLLEQYILRYPEQWHRWYIRDVTVATEGRAAPEL